MEGWARLIGVSSLKSLFEQVLDVYLSEGNERKCVRPFPVLASNGESLDLFKLYWIVRKIGGYELVSRKKLWDYVADFCGLDIGAVACVKLIYVRYLSEFDCWLRELVKDGNVEGGEGGAIRQLDLLSKELETMFRRLLPHRGQEKKETNLFPSKNGCKDELICKGNSKVDFEMFTAESVNETNGGEHRMDSLYNDGERSVSKGDDETVFLVSTKGIVEKILYRAPAKSNRQYDDGEKFFAQDGKNNTMSTGEVIQGAIAKVNAMAGKENDKENLSILNGYDTTVASGKNVIQDAIVSHKRKRESSCFSGMLNWTNYAATHSNDPEIGRVPNSSEWKRHTGNEFWSQALLIREALLEKRHIVTKAEESNPQKKIRMHPSMYEEEKPNIQPAEKVRCSTRIPAPKKHILYRDCSSYPTSQNKVETHQKKDDDVAPDLTSVDVVEVSVTEKTEDSVDQQTYPEVLVGPLYQAEVPEWTGVIYESDSKWLGTRMWPPEVEKTSLVVFDPVGKGRQSSCDCLFPQSVECVRFHIAEKRYELKRELGLLFFRWRFDHMGEEVSFSWTAEEGERFKHSLRSTSKKNLWKNYKKLFPSKTWNMLASYYFNVFLIKRRSYQNRVTPKDLDSDDDEKEFGCVGGSLGDPAVHVASSSSSLTCFQNKVSTDLV